MNDQPPFALKTDPRPTDYVLGSTSPIVFRAVSNGNWTPHLDFFEDQKLGWETDGCVLFTAQESFDAQMDNLISLGEVPADMLSQFNTMGYMDTGLDGKPHFHSSPRFLEVQTGNGQNGNNLYDAWDVMRKYGVLPWKDLPYDSSVTVQEYFAPISPANLDKAAQFLKLIGGKQAIQYHWVINGGKTNVPAMKIAITQAPLCIGLNVGPNWNTQQPPEPPAGSPPGHSVMVYLIDSFVEIYDHYQPAKKELFLTYPIPYVLQGILTITPPTLPPLPVNIPPTVQNVTILQKIVALYQTILSLVNKGRALQANNMSQTQLANFGTAAGLIAFLLSQFGVVFPADKITFILCGLWSLGFTAYNYYQRYQKGDLTLGGVRKTV